MFCFVPAFAIAQADVVVERKLSLGGQLNSGNTDVQSLQIDFYFGRNRTAQDQAAVKGSFNRQFSRGRETEFQANAKLRYSRFITTQFFNYYKLTLDHDNFQEIALRVIPTIGLGYWFLKEVDHNSMLELAIGFEHDFIINQPDEQIVIVNLGSDVTWGIFANNFDLYADPNDLDYYRLVNTTNLRIKLNKFYAFKLTLKEQFNNRPAAGTQKNDLSFLTSLEFASKDVL